MAKTGTQDDNVFGALATKEVKKGRQEDGTYITSTGEVLPAKADRRIPYDELEDKQVVGNEEVVETPDGTVSFLAVRLDDKDFGRKAQHLERKRLQCRYMLTETYAGQPRQFYSYDELEQLRKGELKR